MTVAVAPEHGRAFASLAMQLHGEHPSFVPMLDAAYKQLHSRKNPFWKHARAERFVARQGGKVVGRIAACVDDDLRAAAPGCGVIGFFDTIDDQEVADALFAAAYAWLRNNGCTRARGPLQYSIHDTGGLLVDGFDTPAVVDTTWNPAYYGTLWDRAGWKGAQDMLAAAGALETGGPARGKRFAERARRKGASVRPIDIARFDDEVETLRRVYNAAWGDNWGHVPIAHDDFLYKARDLKAVHDPDLLRIAEVDGEPVGMFLGLPDLNGIVKRFSGKLFPWAWWHLLRAKKKCRRNRVVAMGVIPGYRMRGIEALLMHDAYTAFGDRYQWSEASWVLADNAPMLNGLAMYQLFPYKRWRIYERELS